MARPNKSGLDYFPFDVDFFDDDKIGAISVEFGLKGEITVIKLLCAIYRNGYFILWNDRLKIKLLRNLPGVSAELLEQIIIRLVKWDFFDESLFNSASILTSYGIQKRYFSIVKRRKQNEDYPYILVNVYNNSVNVYNNSVNVCNKYIKESKVKNISTTTSITREDEFIREIKSSQTWIESMCMKFRISIDNIQSRIDDFALDCKCRDITHKDVQDVMRHFNDWLRIQISVDKKQSYYANDKQRADNKRRGNEVTATKAEDYTTTF